jgi:hypothetical protein
VFCTDPLNLNIVFRNGDDIVIVSHDVAAITEQILSYWRAPERLVALSKSTASAFRRVYGYDGQIRPRLRMMRELLAQN